MDIYKSNGDLFTTLADGTTTTANDAPVILAGRNFAGYGKVLNENTIKLAENFASNSPPAGPVLGQIWYNTAHKILYVYKGTTSGWKPLTTGSIQLETPQNPAVGDFWWDTGKDQLKVYAGTGFKVIGPDYEKNWGESGVVPFIVTDSTTIPHVVLKMISGGNIMAIINQDGEFTPQTAIPGFVTIKNGINLNSSKANFDWHGTSDNALQLGGIVADTYVRKDQDSVVNANVTLSKKLHLSDNGTITSDDSTDTISISNIQNNKDIVFYINHNGTQTQAMVIRGITGEIQAGGSFTGTQPSTEQGLAHRGYVTSVRNAIETWTTALVDTTKTELNTTISAIDTRLGSAETKVEGHTVDIRTINAELTTKADIAAPNFVGTPTADTPSLTDDSNKLATTAFVYAIKAQILAELQNWAQNRDNEVRSELVADITPKAPTISPNLLGVPSAPTAGALTSTGQIATTEFVTQAIINDPTWHGSSKTVTNALPTASDGEDGDFWFVLET